MEKEKDINRCQKVFNKHYVIAFWVTLFFAVALLVTGFFLPPMAIIDGSILKAVGELMFWPAIAFGVKAVEDGRVAKFNFGKASVHIGEDENNDGFDDNWQRQQDIDNTDALDD